MFQLQNRGKVLVWIDAASCGIVEAAAARLLNFLQETEPFPYDLFLDLQVPLVPTSPAVPSLSHSRSGALPPGFTPCSFGAAEGALPPRG